MNEENLFVCTALGTSFGRGEEKASKESGCVSERQTEGDRQIERERERKGKSFADQFVCYSPEAIFQT